MYNQDPFVGFRYLLWAGIIMAISSLLYFYKEYTEDRDKKRWFKNIFKALGIGLFVMFLPIGIVVAIALGANKKS